MKASRGSPANDDVLTGGFFGPVVTIEDANKCFDIILAQACVLRAKGVPQWQGMNESRRSEILEYFRKWWLYAFQSVTGGDISATVALLPELPSTYFCRSTDWGVMDSAVRHLCKLAVDPAHKGEGIGSRMLRFAEYETRRLGADRVRLDCVAANPFLEAYYRSFGYVRKGESEYVPGRACIFMEKIIL